MPVVPARRTAVRFTPRPHTTRQPFTHRKKLAIAIATVVAGIALQMGMNMNRSASVRAPRMPAYAYYPDAASYQWNGYCKTAPYAVRHPNFET